MADVLGVFDGGIIREKGRPVGVVLVRISTNEGKPEDLIAHCHPNFRDSIIKNLKRLVWRKQQGSQEDLEDSGKASNEPTEENHGTIDQAAGGHVS